MYSIGHSNHELDKFQDLLHEHKITAIADVRSVPVSKFSPHYNKNELKLSLEYIRVSYVFLGKELGGRPSSYKYFSGSKADYEKMAKAPEYLNGIDRLIRGISRYNIAMMCSEHDPLDCHRCLLVSRTLLERGIDTKHILQNGGLKLQSNIEKELLELNKKTSFDMFLSENDCLAESYRSRSMKIAYSSDGDG